MNIWCCSELSLEFKNSVRKEFVQWWTFVTKFKELYFVLAYSSSIIYELSMSFSTKKPHAGFNLKLGFLGFYLVIGITDCRYCDDNNGCWKNEQ